MIYQPNKVKEALEEHFERNGFKAFRDECYITADPDYGLIVEWGDPMKYNVQGVRVSIPKYEKVLIDWISGYENPSPSGEELYQMELEMNTEHIGVMVQKARQAMRDAETDY